MADAAEETSTALEDDVKTEDTALDAGAPDPDAPLEVPEKFKNEEGKLDEQRFLKSYGELEKTLSTHGKPPETVDDYKVETKYPEGVEIDEELQKAFLGRCHEKGMTNDMVQFIMDEHARLVTEAVVDQTNTREGTSAALKELWGGKYHDNMTAAMNAFKAAGIEGITLKSIGNDPEMIQVLAVLGANLSEDQLPSNMRVVTGGMSDEEVESLMKSEAYWNDKEPDHATVKAKVEAHFKAKHATKKR